VYGQEDLAAALKKFNEALGEAALALDKADEAVPPLYVITGMEFFLNTCLKCTLCRCLYTT
jgi:NADH:ubiquinone oxidoreductase subunit F (NADH-binding)